MGNHLLLFFAHFLVNSIANKAIQAFALAGSKFLNQFSLALGYNNIDPVIGLFVIPGSGFLLRFIVFGIFIHKYHPYILMLLY